MKAQLMQQIESALNSQNFSEALQLGNRLIAGYPNDPEAYTALGDVFTDMENWSKAIENYERALAISPDNAEVYFKLGEAYELKDDFQTARHQFQTARRLDPNNKRYAGHYGRLLHEKGRETKSINLQTEGLQLMEQSLDAETEKIVREQLAIAYIEQSFSVWRQDPEDPEKSLATERSHLDYTRLQLDRAKSLLDGSNPSINNRIAEIETYLADMEKRKFAGYNYLLKSPAIVGGILLLFGQTTFGLILLVMAAAYYVSQLKPGYLFNRAYYKNDYRDPFIVRRLDAMSRDMREVTLWSTSFTDLMMMKFMFRFVFGAIRYGMVIVMLPYEIIKGFVINFDLVQKAQAKMAA